MGGQSASEFYESLVRQAQGLVAGERNYIANTANIASLVYNELNQKRKNNQVNWVGFYFIDPTASSPGGPPALFCSSFFQLALIRPS